MPRVLDHRGILLRDGVQVRDRLADLREAGLLLQRRAAGLLEHRMDLARGIHRIADMFVGVLAALRAEPHALAGLADDLFDVAHGDRGALCERANRRGDAASRFSGTRCFDGGVA